MKKLLYISVLFLFGMTSCIQDYLDDGGTHSAESNTTPYEYLSSHTYHMFDTLIQIIDHYGLEEEMNRAATVFACSDFSSSNSSTSSGASSAMWADADSTSGPEIPKWVKSISPTSL